MKLAARKLSLLLPAMIAISVNIGQAQLIAVLQFTVNSSFAVDNVVLPSGTYTLKQDVEDSGLFTVSDNDGKHSIYVSCENIEVSSPTTKTELTFRKYGDILVLKEIWIAGSTTEMLLPSGPVEKKAAKLGKPTKVSVAASTK